MKKEIIFTKEAPQPTGHYSQAIKIGDLVFTAGQTAKDTNTGEVLFPDNIEAQTDIIMKNIATLLKEAGLSLANVIKTSVFINDIDKFQKFNNAYKKYFPEDPPVRTTVATGNFTKGVCVEIDVVAFNEK